MARGVVDSPMTPAQSALLGELCLVLRDDPRIGSAWLTGSLAAGRDALRRPAARPGRPREDTVRDSLARRLPELG